MCWCHIEAWMPYLNSFGLFLDIVGVIIVLRFPLPNKDGMFHDHGTPEKDNAVRKRAVFGAVLIVIGFSLQLLASFYR